MKRGLSGETEVATTSVSSLARYRSQGWHWTR